MRPGDFQLDHLLPPGELLVISAVLSAGALGELLGAAYRGERTLAVIFAGFGCLATFAGSVICYMAVGTGATPEAIVTASKVIFTATLVASGFAIGTAARR
jgi:hypothetical protein